MRKNTELNRRFLIIFLLLQLLFAVTTTAQTENQFMQKKDLPNSRLQLSRRTQNGSFYDVIGRKSAAFGYEHRHMEAWVYPLKILDDFALVAALALLLADSDHPLQYSRKALFRA